MALLNHTRPFTLRSSSFKWLMVCLAIVAMTGCGAPSNVVPEGELTAEQKEAIELEDNAVDMAEGN